MVNIRRGKTTSSNVRSCDTVRAGAFFSQAELQVPQKEMRQHGREHMMVPASVFAYFIVIHPEFRFAFFKALLNRQPHATERLSGNLSAALLRFQAIFWRYRKAGRGPGESRLSIRFILLI